MSVEKPTEILAKLLRNSASGPELALSKNLNM